MVSLKRNVVLKIGWHDKHVTMKKCPVLLEKGTITHMIQWENNTHGQA